MMSRRLILNFDEHGQDPLGNSKLDRLLEIQKVERFTIEEKYNGNPQLLAYERYGSVDLYYVLLHYNGMGNNFEFTTGLTIYIPDPTSVRMILNSAEQLNVSDESITI